MATRALCFVLVLMIGGCSSSSNDADDDNDTAESVATNGEQTFRLISEQVSLDDGASMLTTYQYDDVGNLIGRVDGTSVTNYSIDANGRITSVATEHNGVASEFEFIRYYEPVIGLTRIDSLYPIDGGPTLGVSGIRVYTFTGNLATGLEIRNIPEEVVVTDTQLDDSAGELRTLFEFVYEGDNLIQMLIDNEADGVFDGQRDYNYNADGTLANAVDSGDSQGSTVYVYEQGACNNNWGNSTTAYFCVSGTGG